VWTNDLSLAHRTARGIRSGMVWINGRGKKALGTPFGGFKHNGIGKEGSLEELVSYTREKSVIINF
jgi:acyl-CoA reductase-like NAD-dependent aldehyde dehydrogenase